MGPCADTGHFAVAAPLSVYSVVEADRWDWLPAGDTHAGRWDREGYAVMASARKQTWRSAEELTQRLAPCVTGLEEPPRQAQGQDQAG